MSYEFVLLCTALRLACDAHKLLSGDCTCTCSIEIGDLCVHFSLSQQYTIHSQNIHALTYQYRRILILCMQLTMQFLLHRISVHCLTHAVSQSITPLRFSGTLTMNTPYQPFPPCRQSGTDIEEGNIGDWGSSVDP